MLRDLPTTIEFTRRVYAPEAIDAALAAYRDHVLECDRLPTSDATMLTITWKGQDQRRVHEFLNYALDVSVSMALALS